MVHPSAVRTQTIAAATSTSVAATPTLFATFILPTAASNSAAPHQIKFGPGEIRIPILLYHHFSDDPDFGRYTVSPNSFAMQLQWLFDNGYHSVSLEDVVTAIKTGKELPEHPFVLTIDDGNADVYTTAFPLIKKYGFKTTVFLIANSIGAKNMLDTTMIQELLSHGWEFGSHSFTHSDLTAENVDDGYEICSSKVELSKKLGLDIRFFAYPYGKANEHAMVTVFKCGYLAGLGLGTSKAESKHNLFYLPRQEVRREYSLEQFQALLRDQ